jgi:ZIP family zinc transporter
VEALLFGVIASSALVIGALAGARVRLPKAVLAAMLAFAAGALITALSFELFEDAYEHGGIWRAALGLLVGAVVFTALSAWLDRVAQPGIDEPHGSDKLDPDAAATDRAPSAASTSGAAGLALLAAVTLDGVPENIALGVRWVMAPGAWRCWPPSSCQTSRRRWSAARPCASRGVRSGSSSAPGSPARPC